MFDKFILVGWLVLWNVALIQALGNNGRDWLDVVAMLGSIIATSRIIQRFFDVSED